MQITEKHRNEIAVSLPKLGTHEVNAIAADCHCSTDTVYREWRKIHGRESGIIRTDNPVVISLAELAVARKKEAKLLAKRLRKSMQQLSAA